MSKSDDVRALAEKIRKGGAQKYHDSNHAAGKLFCRERIARLCDDIRQGLHRGRPLRQRHGPTCPPTAW
jgi:acetyl-CoA carboxylase carboxyltransferase component